MVALDIQKQDAYIGLRSNRPNIRIQQNQADMHIRQKHSGIIEISTTASQLFIDQTEAFADANLKSPLRVANEFWQKAQSTASQYVAQKAQEGEQLKHIENGQGAIAHIAKANSQLTKTEVGLGFMPTSMSQVKFDYQPSRVSLHAPYQEVEISVQKRPPQIDIPKWQVEAYVQQKNQISFRAVGGNVNMGL